MNLLTPAVRRYVYGIALVVVPILVAYGLLDDTRAPLWVALVSAVLVPGLALANTPKPADPATDPEADAGAGDYEGTHRAPAAD